MRQVNIEIGGARYRMTTDSDEAHIRKLAAAVDERIQALGPAAKRIGNAQLLAVIALSLMEEVQAQSATLEEMRTRTRALLDEAVGDIDGRLAALAREADEAAPE